MIVTTASHLIEQPLADSNGGKETISKNISSDAHHDVGHARSGKRPRPNNQPRRDKRDVHGWVVLDKPIGMTSTQAVAVVKRLFQAKRAGHAGTLDPLASGGLPIALGEATKTVPFVMDGRKRYRFTVAWGEERDTDDTEGRATRNQRSAALDRSHSGPAAAIYRNYRTDPAAIFGYQGPGRARL